MAAANHSITFPKRHEMLGAKSRQTNEKTLTVVANSSKESQDTCVVAAGTTIEGKFSSSENVRLDGQVKGEVKCALRLVMGETGKIEGNVRTKDAIIMGTIEGELVAEGSLHLKSTAVIRGTINAKNLTVDEGARYIGECKIG
jgi:cytoskeletal protein CcmA (bactofilin family)